MAQHDYVIDNSTGANVRADLNNALLAISSNNSGSSAPSTTYALQTFANTTDSMLQLRNAANNAFVNLRKFDGTLPLPDGSASSPSLFFDDDTNTGIFSSAADTLNFSTGGTERIRIDSSGNLGINQAPTRELSLHSPNNNNALIHFTNDDTGETSADGILVGLDGNENMVINNQETGKTINFTNGGSERMRIDSSGRVLIGTTTEGQENADDFTVAGSANSGITIRSGTSSFGQIFFSDGTSGDDEFRGIVGYSHTDNFMKFHTNAVERLRIDSSGRVLIGTTSGSDALVVDGGSDAGTITTNSTNSNGNMMTFNCSGTNKFFIGSAGSFITGHSGTTDQGIRAEGKLIFAAGGHTERMSINTIGRVFISESAIADFDAFLTVHVGATTAAFASHSGTTATRHALACCNNNGHVGGITTSGSATSFNTSSDYRLKENATAISDGITRLKTLKPYRFNFKADASTTVDGFFAHEVTAVPEAISGEKDAVKEDGSIDPQGIDQSKLVPLLVAAVQELIGKVEALEAA